MSEPGSSPHEINRAEDSATISKASSQLINCQSGLGCSTSQVGSRANPAVQKTHFATAECANSTRGRDLQRIRKRYAEMTGTNHPKLYCGLIAQRTERCLISKYHSVPKRTRGRIRFKNFCRLPIIRKPNGNAVMPLSCPRVSANAF